MARLTPPKPSPEDFEKGFGPHDKLGREQKGDQLSDLVERISEPMVIALDGGWGSGKSFFLNCWVAAHRQSEKHTGRTVYFDAFAHDFMDAPLVSLLTCLSGQFETATAEDKTKFEKVKSAAWKMAPGATRILASWATFGASNHLGDEGDAIVEALGKEIASSAPAFWKKAEDQHNAMRQFSEALSALTSDAEGNTQKLVIVIDELDRCRPDYALSLLEIIKHFFAFDHVHFVLGVNLSELENSVKARYGTGIDAGLYLQKFVTLTMGLPTRTDDGKENYIKFLRESASGMGISEPVISDAVIVLNCFKDKKKISLRAVERFLSYLALVPNEPTHLDDMFGAYRMMIVTLAWLKTAEREFYETLLEAKPAIKDVKIHFLLYTSRETDNDHHPFVLNRAWGNFLDIGIDEDEEGWRGFDIRRTMRQRQNTLLKLMEECLETFSLPDQS
jgi:hypothetical protein